MSRIKLVQGDTRPDITIVLVDADTRAGIDVSGGGTSVKLKFRPTDGETLQEITGIKLAGAVAEDGSIDETVTTAGQGGRVRFVWPNGALNVDPGYYEAEITIDYADDTTQTVYDLLKFDVRANVDGVQTPAAPYIPTGATETLTANDMASAEALQAAVDALAGKYPVIPPGTWPLDMLSSPTEIDISGLGGLAFSPGALLTTNNPSRGLLRMLETDRLIIHGMDLRQQFLAGIARPDIGWTHTLNAAGTAVVSANSDMIAWINAWNLAYGVNISNSGTSTATFKERWNAVYTSSPFATLGQISSNGRPSGLLMDGCSRTQILGPRGNHLVALINDQGGTRTGEDVYGFGTYVDSVEVTDDIRFGYLGKGVATTIDRVTCNTNGTRDSQGAPHGVYVAGSAAAGNVNTALQIRSVQARFWGIGPFIKAREASLALGPMVGEQVQSMLGLVHCTGSVGPITSVDQVLNTEATGSGSKFVANFTDCYDLSVGRISAQHRASTPTVSQDALRAVDINGADRLRLEGIDVTCNRLSSASAMVRLALADSCSFGPGSLLNTGDTSATMYEFPADGLVGGPSIGNRFAPVRCSTNATIAAISGSSRGNIFEVDARLLTDGYTEGTTIDDESFGASNQINLTNGVRVVPLSAAPSFLTRSNATLIMDSGGDEDDTTVIDEEYGTSFVNGQIVTTPGARPYTARTALTGSGDEFKIATTAEGGLSTSIKRLRAAINNELLGGRGSTAVSGANAIYNNGNNDHDTFSAISSGRTLTVYAKTTGPAADGQAVSISGTGGAWTSATTTGGDGVDRKLFGARLAYTTAGSALTVAMPSTAETGETLEQVIVDQVGGSLKIQTSAGVPISTVTRSDAPIKHVYDGGWVLDHVPNGYLDLSLFGAVGDGTTDCSAAFAAALAQAAEERLTVQVQGGPDKIYYWPTTPGAVINAAVSTIKSVTYDWISIEAVGGPVTILCGIEQTAAAAAVTPTARGASTKAFLKANSSTGGTFQLKGTFIVDGGKDQGAWDFSTFTGADPAAAAALEVTGYDQVLFDDLRVKNTYGNADMRADPDYGVYNATNNPLGSLYKGGIVISGNGLVKGKLTVGSVWREGPFITASNVRREIEFEYINPIAYGASTGLREPVSTPLNLFGRQKSGTSPYSLYGPENADTYTYLKIGKVSGPWRGSLVNVGWSGDLVLEGTSEITGLVPTTVAANATASATQYGPGIDCSSEVNFGVSRSIELRSLRFKDNHRYSLSLARSSSGTKIRRAIGDVAVQGGWSGPNIQNIDFADLAIRCYDVCDYTNAGDYGTALRLYTVGSGDVRVDLNGATQVGTAKSYIGMARQYSGCVVRGRIQDFNLCCISDNNVSSITDNTYDSLYGDMEVVTSTYTTSSDSGKIIRIGRSDSNRAKRAEISRLRLDGVPVIGTGRAAVYAVSLPGVGDLVLGTGKQSLTSDEFGRLIWVNDDPSSPGPGTKARLYAVTDANGRDAELYAETRENTSGSMHRYPLRGPSLRNISGVDYYPPTGLGFGTNTLILIPDTLYLLGWDGHVKSLGPAIEVTAAVPASSLRLGVYQGTPEGNVGALLEESATIDTTAAGLKAFSFSTDGTRRRLGPNQFLALVASHGITVRAYTSDPVTLQRVNGSASLTATTGISHWTGSHTYGALPTTIPTLTGQTTNAPMIYVRRG